MSMFIRTLFRETDLIDMAVQLHGMFLNSAPQCGISCSTLYPGQLCSGSEGHNDIHNKQ